MVLQEIRSYQGMQLHNQDEVLYYQKREPSSTQCGDQGQFYRMQRIKRRLRRSTTMLYYCNQPIRLTFSKILAPGMRIGWVVMPDWLAQQTVIVKQAADLHTNMLSQVITAEYLGMNRLENQIALIREDYRKKCVALADALESRLGEHLEFSRPQGGMFLWARFRYPFDTMEWMKKTLENGVVYVPGEAFYHDKPDTRTLRLSYSTVSEAGLLTAVERLAASL